MEKYVCVHGHFYQPPRENPWLEAIELQESAYPYHDWNERITAECYGPNATSRILDSQGRIGKIVNNYARMSFNFGPTLLSWMESFAPAVYRRIQEADRMSMDLFGGHGSAMAQGYNHMVLPLADSRDKFTQILWGIRDFTHRFGRMPEGMWLPETAVDLESLDMMAGLGIRFTVLAPHQAVRVRVKGAAEWTPAASGNVDTSRAYEVALPSGRRMAVFFYNGGASHAVAFEGLLKNGEKFASRLLESFPAEREGAALVSIATDGETYGHHHRFGNMALAYALSYIEDKKLAKITNFGRFLELAPPEWEAEIAENTSWSCAHGVERWRSNCGCATSSQRGWTQEWRGPLRDALDWLRGELEKPYETNAAALLKDPWEARNEYIAVILDRSPESVEKFLGANARRELTPEEKMTALKLLECQRNAMLMFTSCGWFFADVSGIETIQILHYAGRAIELATQVLGKNFDFPFLERLEEAKSNLPAMRDARRIYENLVPPSAVNLEKVCAHFSISSIFNERMNAPKVYCYTVVPDQHEAFKSGRASLLLGSARVISDVTREEEHFTFGALHFGDQNLQCGVREYVGAGVFNEMARKLGVVFRSGDLPATIREMDKFLGESLYSLKSLFKEEQKRILESLLKSTLADTESIYRQIYENNAPLMRFISGMKVPPPNALRTAAEFVINADLRRLLAEERMDLERVTLLLGEAKEERVALDTTGLAFEATNTLERLIAKLLEAPGEVEVLERMKEAVDTAFSLPFEVGVREVQNGTYAILKSEYPEFNRKAAAGDENARRWTQLFLALCENLKVSVPSEGA